MKLKLVLCLAAEWSSAVEEICDTHANKADAEGARIAQDEPWLEQIAEMPLPQGKESEAKEFDQRMRDLMPTVRDMADTVRDDDSSKAELKQVSQELLKQALPVRALARDLNIHACIPNNSAA